MKNKTKIIAGTIVAAPIAVDVIVTIVSMVRAKTHLII